MRLSSAVLFVSDLDRSVVFYSDLLSLTVVVKEPTAALLATDSHYQLYLREVGKRTERAQGSIGIQYLIWGADDANDLTRCEEALRRESHHVTRESRIGIDIVEGIGPDQVPIIVVYPGPDKLARDQIIPRIYSW